MGIRLRFIPVTPVDTPVTTTPTPATSPTPAPTRIKPYKVYEYPWTTAPTDYEIDFGGMVNTLTFIHAPTDCSVKLESADNDSITDIADDKKIDGVSFSKIYITSSNTNESVKFFAAWV